MLPYGLLLEVVGEMVQKGWVSFSCLKCGVEVFLGVKFINFTKSYYFLSKITVSMQIGKARECFMHPQGGAGGG